MLSRVAVAACAALLATSAPAQQTGELWEMTSQMSMQGMPAGMIPAQTQQVCQGQNFDRTPGEQDRSKCTISNMRQSPTRIQYDVRCEGNPPTTGSADYQFEANRTRMKGTMRMQTRDGEMVMQMTGRKVGACNPEETRRAQQKQVDDLKKQAADAQKQSDDSLIKGCRADLDKMQPGFGLVGMCAMGEKAYCAPNATSPAVRSACTADMNEFCKRYQTRDGLLKIGTRKDTLDRAGKMCKQPVASIRARLCPVAVKEDALRFVAQHCPAEAKLIAQKECGGRKFSVAEGSKYFEFCGSYRGAVADAGDDDATSSGTLSKPAARSAAQSQPSQPSQPAQPAAPAPADAASQAIQEGLGKLKGLFGR
jgi:hypothetical protein